MGLLREFRERYAIRTPVAELQARARTTEMQRTLGPGQLTALGVGAIVGAGIFTVTGLAAAEHAGPSISLAFVLVAVVSALVALSYAELATLIPLGGSAYTYASASMGELVGWLVAWALVLSYGIGNAAVASSFSDNVTGLLATFGVVLPGEWTAAWGARDAVAGGAAGIMDVPALLVIALVTIILLRPVKESATANAILVAVKVGVLLLFVFLGVTAVEPMNWSPFAPGGTPGILTGAGLIFFAFLGFDAISTAAEETREPQRNLPLGILGSLVVVTLLFVAVSLVLTGLVPAADLNTGEPLAFALRAAGFGAWASGLLNVGGLVATLSVLLVFQLATTRIFLAVARDGLFPKGWAALHPRNQTPNRVTIALGVTVGLASAFLPLDFLVSLTNDATLFFFALVCVAVVLLRKQAPEAARGFKCPGMPWLPLGGAAACLALMYTFGWTIHYGFLLWMGVGLMVYAMYGARNSTLRRRLEPERVSLTPEPPVVAVAERE